MIEKINKLLAKLKRKLPNCHITYGPNVTNKNLVDFYIYFDRRKKYIKISIIKYEISKINIRLLVQDIQTIMNKQYYNSEIGVVLFDEFINEEKHIPRID